jgi:hypothetical protein
MKIVRLYTIRVFAFLYVAKVRADYRSMAST